MIDYLEIGPAPCDEECSQVGDLDYYDRAPKECRRFIELIRTKLGREPYGAQLTMKANPHDFGSYYEVIVKFDTNNPEAVEYAFKVEAEAPKRWE